MSELALLEYGKPFGVQRWLKRAPEHTQKLWRDAEIEPRAIDREVSTAMHMTHMGNSCKVIFPGDTSVKFKNKDLSPLVVSSNDPKYNTDLLFITIPLEKGVVTKINGKKAAVLKHIIAHDMIALVVSIRPYNGRYVFELTVHNEEKSIVVKYGFERQENSEKYTSSIIESQLLTEEGEVEPLKIPNFRPQKPTHLIFVNNKDEKEFNEVCKAVDKHYVIYYNDANNLPDFIEEAHKDRYKAVTLFVGKDNEKADPEVFELMKKSFMFMNIMYGTGKVSIIK